MKRSGKKNRDRVREREKEKGGMGGEQRNWKDGGTGTGTETG